MKASRTNLCFSILVIILSSLVIMLQPGCGKKKNSIPLASDTTLVPCQEVGKSTLYCYDGAHLIWKLDSKYSRKTLEDTSSMLVVPVRLVIYDTLKPNRSLVLADSGLTKKSMEHFYIWGNVYVKNWDGLIIKSQSLWWNKPTRKVGSDDLVEIKTTSGDILRGKGLDANESFSQWSLRQNVSGEFPNFKKRMDADEKF